MNLKKCGLIAATTAVLLVIALLVTTCDGPFGVDGLLGKSTSEKATLSLNLTDGRTIMPTVTISSFSNFWLELDDGTTQTPYTATTVALLNAQDLELTIGEDYTITLEAYTGGAKGSGGVLAASGTGTITGAVAGSNPVTINLELETTGSGTFTFTITNQANPNDFTGGNYAITPLSGGSSVSSTSITFGTAQSETLDAGFYRVSFTYTKARHQTRTVNEILHIFPGITSTYTNAPTALAKNNFDVTFDANGGDLTGDLLTTNPLTADWNTSALVGGTVANPTPPTVPGTATFGGWFETAALADGSTGTPFVPGTTVVYKDYITTNSLFARWIAASVNEVGLTVNFTNVTDITGVLTTDAATTIPIATANNTPGVTITLDSSNQTTLDLNDYDIAWYLSEVTLGTALSTSDTFTISSGNFATLTTNGPEIQLVVELTPKTSGYMYNVNVTVTIQ